MCFLDICFSDGPVDVYLVRQLEEEEKEAAAAPDAAAAAAEVQTPPPAAALDQVGLLIFQFVHSSATTEIHIHAESCIAAEIIRLRQWSLQVSSIKGIFPRCLPILSCALLVLTKAVLSNPHLH